MTKVAAVITEVKASDAERRARAALKMGADLVELRLDYLRDLTPSVLRHLAASTGSRAIATLRSASQGGARSLPAQDRLSILSMLTRLNFHYVDLEMETDTAHIETLWHEAARRHQDIIVSHHFDTPVEVSDAADALEACLGMGDVGKVALPAANFEQACDLVELARNRRLQSRRFVLLGTDPIGMLTRVLAEDVGQEIQYSAFGQPSAPGQLGLETAARLARRTPVVLGLVGQPIGHSVSPQIHEAAFAAANLPAVYLPFEIQQESLEALLHAHDRLRLRGFNVTIPYKETVAEMVDELDGDAEALRAVNTVVMTEGWTKGHNTDTYGFRMALRSKGLRVGGKDALVVGAGGAAKAAVHVLLREGARVRVTNRTASRAESLVEAFDEPVDVVDAEDLPQDDVCDLLINATPVGMKGGPDGLPVPEASVAKAKFVFDLVYNPPETPLLRAAKRAGVPGISGIEMLLHQAAQSFELWTGIGPPFGAMEAAAREALG